MDVVDFAEKICGAKLNKWQKHYIRFLHDLSHEHNIRIVMGKNGQVFTYVKPKELTQNGSTNAYK